ncbi:hypothetical protein N7510_009264 [Penicillium lagena]|uniref:uncharacterized protein n=1 Tax=Penicillium lagena TaxID=94218 RepID=UPI00253F7A1D|nr:uncharacterized protein N7510_009264 [Penicillium lagena]KAJ5606483.1 hypothetical protein N7510_009264 [Penicillium lagena]
MARAKPPVVKAACLAWGRDCSYQPSRRGGVRRGARYAEEQRRRLEPENPPSSFSPSSPPEITESLGKCLILFSSLSLSDCFLDPALDKMIGLVSPFSGLHNLDLSPDSLSDTLGGRHFWEQFTPSTEGPHNSVSAADVEQPTARAYQSEADMYAENPQKIQLTNSHETVSMPTTCIFTYISHYCRHQQS